MTLPLAWFTHNVHVGVPKQTLGWLPLSSGLQGQYVADWL